MKLYLCDMLFTVSESNNLMRKRNGRRRAKPLDAVVASDAMVSKNHRVTMVNLVTNRCDTTI